jgi:TatD DNase family protein
MRPTARKGKPGHAMFADTHVHLNSPQFSDDLQAVLDRARAAAVDRFLCAGYDLESSRRAVEIAAAHPGVLAAVGIHPHDARTWTPEIEATLESWLGTGAAVVAGEMGLDYYYEHSPRETQREVLRAQLRLARRHGVPAIVHNRDSDDDMVEILTAEAEGLRLVLHAYNGSAELGELGRRMGFFFGIGGFLTFAKHPLASRIGELPLPSLLLETDAPYLAPHPKRGRRNEPAFVPYVATRLAEILGSTPDEIASRTSANFTRFLGD